jgi:hypothetical protein
MELCKLPVDGRWNRGEYVAGNIEFFDVRQRSEHVG